MNPAWQVRAYERQQLLEKLLKMTWGEEERSKSKDFSFELLSALAAYLPYLREVAETGNGSFDCSRPAALFVVKRLVPEVERFVRVPAEQGALFADLLRKISETACMPFYSQLSRVERESPQTVFHAESAMADVPFREEREEKEN